MKKLIKGMGSVAKRDSSGVKGFSPNGGRSVAVIKSTPLKRATVVTNKGEVPQSKLDSIRRVNPKVGKQIGSGYKDVGGKTRFGPEASDVLRGALKGGKK